MVNPGRDTARPLYPPGFDQATILAKLAAVAGITEFTTTDPTNPGSSVTLLARKRANRDLLGFIGPTGLSVEVGPHFGTRGISFAKPVGGAVTAPAGVGFNGTGIGTATIATIASGSARAQARRLAYVSAAGAGSSSGWFHNILTFWRGNAANLGGFHIVVRFSFLTMPATVRFFCGLTTSVAALANAEPSSNANLLGVLFDSTDVNFQLTEVDATPTVLKHDAGFTWDQTSVFELRLYCKPNDTKVDASIQKLPAGTLFEATLNTNIPLNTQFLTLQLWLNNVSTASACAVEFISAYAESDY